MTIKITLLTGVILACLAAASPAHATGTTSTQIQMLPPTDLDTTGAASTVCSGTNALLSYSASTTPGTSGINCSKVTTDGSGNLTVPRNSVVGGMLGIGTTTPIMPLDVSGDMHLGGDANPTITSQGAYFGWNAQHLYDGIWHGETDFINQSGLGSGGFAFFNLNNATLTSLGSATPPLVVITGEGNVGIGTTTPQATLDVHGEVRPGNSGTACSAASEGAIRYNAGIKRFEGCNSFAWMIIGGGSGGACFWQQVTMGNHYVECPAGYYVTGIHYEDPEWTNVIDNQLYPEVDGVSCCPL